MFNIFQSQRHVHDGENSDGKTRFSVFYLFKFAPPPPTSSLSFQAAVASANSSYTARIQDFFDSKICPGLPPAAEKACLQYIDNQIPAIWTDLINEILNPLEACTELGLCVESSESGDLQSSGDVIECKICKQAAKFVDKKVGALRLRIFSICSFVPVKQVN